MTVASLAHSSVVRPSCYAGRTQGEEKRAKKLVVGVLFLAIFVFGFLYVFVTTNIATKGYNIKSLSQKISELDSMNKNLQVEVSNLRSVNILEAKSNDLQMVKAQKVEYVSLPRASAMLVK
jgi:cell division protein FtsL